MEEPEVNNKVGQKLPAQFLDDLARTARRRSVRVGTLFHGWLLDAYRLVQDGHGDRLPPASLPRQRGTAPPQRTMRWSHDQDLFDEQRSAIEGVGSAVPAVLLHVGQLYIDTDGDALRMNWPPKSALAAA